MGIEELNFDFSIKESSDNSNLIALGDCTVPCLFCVDDLVLIYKTKEGLHELLNILDKYSVDWKMMVNIEKKNKVVIFHKQVWVLKGEKLYYRYNCLENVMSGIIMSDVKCKM